MAVSHFYLPIDQLIVGPKVWVIWELVFSVKWFWWVGSNSCLFLFWFKYILGSISLFLLVSFLFLCDHKVSPGIWLSILFYTQYLFSFIIYLLTNQMWNHYINSSNLCSSFDFLVFIFWEFVYAMFFFFGYRICHVLKSWKWSLFLLLIVLFPQ